MLATQDTSTNATAPPEQAQEVPIDPILLGDTAESQPSRISTDSDSETRGVATDTFREIVNSHIQLVEEDDLDNEPVRSSEPIRGPWKLTELFDFT